jgi:SAM-dependent methyltransferase
MELGREDNLLSNTYNSENIIARVYFRWKVMTAIKLAGLSKDDVILDFGCGDGWLEHKLKNYKIYGYDINPKKTKIKDYRKIKPSKIFVPIEEIKKIIKDFKKMGKFELIVSQPTENLLSRNVRKMIGKKDVPDEHITRYEEIVRLMKKEFKLVKRVNFCSVSHIFLFQS